MHLSQNLKCLWALQAQRFRTGQGCKHVEILRAEEFLQKASWSKTNTVHAPHATLCFSGTSSLFLRGVPVYLPKELLNYPYVKISIQLQYLGLLLEVQKYNW